MAIRKPLVIVNGQIEQIQNGDSLAEVDLWQATAAAALTAGQAVYPSTNDTVNKAKADSGSTAKVVGLCTADISNAAVGPVQDSGILTLTTTQWDAIAGTTGGLAAGTYYYLSAATAGSITATAPSTVGQYVVQIGLAISTTELKIDIQQSILL